MRVTLNEDGLFGPDGPKKGDKAVVMEIRKNPDGDIYLVVVFHSETEGIGWGLVEVEKVLWPDTSGTETFWTSDPEESGKVVD